MLQEFLAEIGTPLFVIGGFLCLLALARIQGVQAARQNRRINQWWK